MCTKKSSITGKPSICIPKYEGFVSNVAPTPPTRRHARVL